MLVSDTALDIGIVFATALAFALWMAWWRRRDASAWIRWSLPLGVASVTLVSTLAGSGFDVDESEHLHVAYLLGQGVLPYRDVTQFHAPLLWIATAPLLSWLPESPYLLFAFRALAAGCFLASVGIAARLALGMTPRAAGLAPSGVVAACAFLALAQAVASEVYLFRPDSFMMPLGLASVLWLTRSAGGRARPALLAGFALGLAVSMTPKVAQLALLAPVAFWLGNRAHALRSLALYATGGIAGLLPMLLWLAGHGLLSEAWGSIFGAAVGNASVRWEGGAIPLLVGIAERRLAEIGAVLAVSVAGAVWALASARRDLATKQRPEARAERLLGSGLPVLAWGLWLASWSVSANPALYHVAGALVLGAALGAPVLSWLEGRSHTLAGALACGSVLALCLGVAPVRAALGRESGLRYPVAQVAALLETVREKGGGCLCLAPRHPIFVRTGSPVYMQREFYADRGPEMVRFVLTEEPGVVWAGPWDELVARGSISEEQRRLLMRFLNDRYEPKRFNATEHIRGDLFWVRQTRVRPVSPEPSSLPYDPAP